MKLITMALACALSFAIQVASAQAESKDKAPATIQVAPITTEQAGFDTGITIVRHPLSCIREEYLVVQSAGRKFYSCNDLNLAAVVEADGRQFAIASTKQEAAYFRKNWPKQATLGPGDRLFGRYMAEYFRLRRLRIILLRH